MTPFGPAGVSLPTLLCRDGPPKRGLASRLLAGRLETGDVNDDARGLWCVCRGSAVAGLAPGAGRQDYTLRFGLTWLINRQAYGFRKFENYRLRVRVMVYSTTFANIP